MIKRDLTRQAPETEAQRLYAIEGAAVVATENLQRYLRQLPPDRQRRVLEQLRRWLSQ